MCEFVHVHIASVAALLVSLAETKLCIARCTNRDKQRADGTRNHDIAYFLMLLCHCNAR
jgi:hypothetical protein